MLTKFSVSPRRSVSTQIVIDRSNYKDLPLPILRNIQGTGIQVDTKCMCSALIAAAKTVA